MLKQSNGDISVKKLKGYQEDYYISDRRNIKPRKMHEISKTFKSTIIRKLDVNAKEPKLVIIGNNDLENGISVRYDSKGNTLYIKQYESKNTQDYVIRHELMHWNDSQNFIKNTGIKDNREIIKHFCKVGKQNLILLV